MDTDISCTWNAGGEEEGNKWTREEESKGNGWVDVEDWGDSGDATPGETDDEDRSSSDSALPNIFANNFAAADNEAFVTVTVTDEDAELRRCRQPEMPMNQLTPHGQIAHLTAMPDWRMLGPQFPDLVLQPNAANGDCQFWALAQAINGYTGCAKEELHARIRLLSLIPGEITAMQLRALAYSVFLLPSEETDGYLQHWKTNSADPSMGDAYRHARYLSDKRVDTLTATQRRELFDILMDSIQTWGDETSLILLERLLRVRVDVLFDSHLQIRDMCHPADFQPIVYTIMNLYMKHYECVLHHIGDGILASAFATQELPLPIVHLHLRDCASAVDAYVRLVVPAASPLQVQGASDCASSTSTPGENSNLQRWRLRPNSTDASFSLTTISADFVAACPLISTASSIIPIPLSQIPPTATVATPSVDCSTLRPAAKDALLEHALACMAQQRLEPTTVVPPGPPPAMVEADGGTQYPGRMESKVVRLQCGLAVGDPAPYEALFSSHFISNRIPRANPPRLWS